MSTAYRSVTPRYVWIETFFFFLQGTAILLSLWHLKNFKTIYWTLLFSIGYSLQIQRWCLLSSSSEALPSPVKQRTVRTAYILWEEANGHYLIAGITVPRCLLGITRILPAPVNRAYASPKAANMPIVSVFHIKNALLGCDILKKKSVSLIILTRLMYI